jgi:vacuolar-type H+-ATPase subunit I/STV1
MGFFKESGSATSSKSIARLQQLIWILIYGGLLTLVLGLSVQRMDEDLGWSMVVGGAIVAAIGFVLIYVRSRLTSN